MDAVAFRGQREYPKLRKVPGNLDSLRARGEEAKMNVGLFPAAFVRPTMQVIRVNHESSSCPHRHRTRRDVLRLFAGTIVGVAGVTRQAAAGLAAEEKPSLPGGAAQFSRLLAAQRQWNSLDKVVYGDRQLESDEWESLRGYLRTVYAVSGDMAYLTKVWDKPLRNRGQEVIKRFRATVKEMDKPAIARDITKFASMYAETGKNFEEFFELLKEASVKDIPDEL